MNHKESVEYGVCDITGCTCCFTLAPVSQKWCTGRPSRVWSSKGFDVLSVDTIHLQHRVWARKYVLEW